MKKNTKKIILASGVVLSLGLGLAFINGQTYQAPRSGELAAEVGGLNAPNVKTIPGTNDSFEYVNKLTEADKQRAIEAEKQLNKGQGVVQIPKLKAATNEADMNVFTQINLPVGDKKDVNVNLPQPEIKKAVSPPQASTNVQQKPAAIPMPPREKGPEYQKNELILEKTVESLLKSWQPGGAKNEYDYAGKTRDGQSGPLGQSGGVINTAGMQNQAGFPNQSSSINEKQAIVKAGNVMSAVLLTSINSDEPGPILAQVVSGPFTGARLLGTFSKPQNSDTVVLQFSSLSSPELNKSLQISSFAVDPNTARTAMASDVDNRYLERYGSFLASSFLKGYGQAVAQSGTTQTIQSGQLGASSTTSFPILNPKDKAIVALGQTGSELASVLKDNFKRPPTIYLNAGTPLGILVMSDILN